MENCEPDAVSIDRLRGSGSTILFKRESLELNEKDTIRKLHLTPMHLGSRTKGVNFTRAHAISVLKWAYFEAGALYIGRQEGTPTGWRESSPNPVLYTSDPILGVPSPMYFPHFRIPTIWFKFGPLHIACVMFFSEQHTLAKFVQNNMNTLESNKNNTFMHNTQSINKVATCCICVGSLSQASHMYIRYIYTLL